VDFGYVGNVAPESVNVAFLKTLLAQGVVPVLNAINHDGDGNLLNTNADTIASSVAAAMKGELLYLFEKKGVLYDVEDENSVIPEISPARYEELKGEGRIAKGMLPKLENAFSALRSGASGVVIKHSTDLLTEGAGTKLSL